MFVSHPIDAGHVDSRFGVWSSLGPIFPCHIPPILEWGMFTVYCCIFEIGNYFKFCRSSQIEDCLVSQKKLGHWTFKQY